VSTELRRAVAADHEAVCRLLREAELPLDGLSPTLEHFVVAETDGAVTAAAGLELYGADALLRSVVVAAGRRGSGLGKRLVEATRGSARDLGVRDVYLLTDTADQFFARHGFTVIERAQVPAGIRSSAEFASVCPDSAIVMRDTLLA
jgi:N-acetylglutamate synthase-like GNAT family acetyltransferase